MQDPAVCLCAQHELNGRPIAWPATWTEIPSCVDCVPILDARSTTPSLRAYPELPCQGCYQYGNAGSWPKHPLTCLNGRFHSIQGLPGRQEVSATALPDLYPIF